jgi:hypothetical protein
VSALDKLHRGPDRYARRDLRTKARIVRTFAPDDLELALGAPPELVGEHANWRDVAVEVADALTEALDRLDDAEALIEERG